jgi:hypothetical protein
LNAQCPWRIVNEFGIALGSEDDAQKFGLPAPVDGAKVAMELLALKPLSKLVITDTTGDLLLEFESGVRLELFNNSSGCEGWNCGTPSGLSVIGMGGGWNSKLKPRSLTDQSQLAKNRVMGKVNSIHDPSHWPSLGSCIQSTPSPCGRRSSP